MLPLLPYLFILLLGPANAERLGLVTRAASSVAIVATLRDVAPQTQEVASRPAARQNPFRPEPKAALHAHAVRPVDAPWTNGAPTRAGP